MIVDKDGNELRRGIGFNTPPMVPDCKDRAGVSSSTEMHGSRDWTEEYRGGGGAATIVRPMMRRAKTESR